VNGRTAPTVHWASLHQEPSRLSFSNQQVATPLNKADLLMVVLVTSLWLWIATWAMSSAAFR